MALVSLAPTRVCCAEKERAIAIPQAYGDDNAAEVTGIPASRIRFWETTDVLRPSIATGYRRDRWWRLYDFRDVVGLRILQDLREQHGVPLRELRRVGRYLADHHEAQWSVLGIAVADRKVRVRDPATGAFDPGGAPGDGAVPLDLPRIVQEIEVEAAKLQERKPEDIGRIVQTRHVLGGAPRLAGLRLGTSSVWCFHESGHDAEAIKEAYPFLTDEDIAAAIAFERERRGLPAA